MSTGKGLLWANGIDLFWVDGGGDQVLVWGKQLLLCIRLMPTCGYLSIVNGENS